MSAYVQYPRGNFYDMRNLPSYYGNYAYGYGYSMPPRVLNRRFKKSKIQLNEKDVFNISVQSGKGKHNQSLQLCFSIKRGEMTDNVYIPEPIALQFNQQLQKLLKWKPSGSGSLPNGQTLILDDVVYRSQIVAEGTPEDKTYLIEIIAETRAKAPTERREIGSTFIPIGADGLSSDVFAKLKNAMNEALTTDSPLYHTRSHQGSDGSKFYLDLIRDDGGHYLKISQVTRDFRSIIHVPADDLEAFNGLIDSSLKAMKEVQQKSKAPKKKRKQPKRRPRKSESDEKENETASSKDQPQQDQEDEQPATESDSCSVNNKGSEVDGTEEHETEKEKKVNEQGDQPKEKGADAEASEKSEGPKDEADE